MKKIFILFLPGAEDKFIVADNQEEAFERRAEVDHAYEYLPVQVKELEMEGYEIHAIPLDKPPEQPKQTKKSSKK